MPIQCLSGVNPSSISCQSVANPMPIECQPIPIWCQTTETPIPTTWASSIHWQSSDNSAQIHFQSIVNSLFIPYPMSIHDQSLNCKHLPVLHSHTIYSITHLSLIKVKSQLARIDTGHVNPNILFQSVRKWIDTDWQCIDMHWQKSSQLITNRRTIPHVTRELVYYAESLLVSTEDDLVPETPLGYGPMQHQSNHSSTSQANPVPIRCQSIPIWCQTTQMPIPATMASSIHRQSSANSAQIHFQSIVNR